MKPYNRFLFHAIAAVFLLNIPLAAQAAHVTAISNLDIGGIFYNVTFVHDSFVDIFDADGDYSFDAAGDKRPEFWGNPAGAATAGLAIMNALGSEGWTYGGKDTAAVPFNVHPNGNILAAVDVRTAPNTDIFYENLGMGAAESDQTYAVFTTGVPVPVPSSIVLLGAGLFLIAGKKRKKK